MTLSNSVTLYTSEERSRCSSIGRGSPPSELVYLAPEARQLRHLCGNSADPLLTKYLDQLVTRYFEDHLFLP